MNYVLILAWLTIAFSLILGLWNVLTSEGVWPSKRPREERIAALDYIISALCFLLVWITLGFNFSVFPDVRITVIGPFLEALATAWVLHWLARKLANRPRRVKTQKKAA